MDNNVLAASNSGGGTGNIARARAGDLVEPIAPSCASPATLRFVTALLQQAMDQTLRCVAENTLAKAPAVSATEPTVNLADNSQIKVEPAATPASEAEALASSTRVAQGRAATELPSQVTKDEIASAKIQSAPAAAPAAGADSKTKSDTMAAAAPPVAQPSSAGSLGMTQQFSQQSAVQSFRNNAQVSRAANVLNTFQVQQQGK